MTRCKHGFLARLCTVVSCPHWDGLRAKPSATEVIGQCLQRKPRISARRAEVLSRITGEWAQLEDMKELSSALSDLVRLGFVERRPVARASGMTGGQLYEYRRLR